MSGSVVPFQFQFDVVSGLTVAAGFVSLLLRACTEDDIQPAAIASLELLGDLLLADPERIQAGVDALNVRYSSWWRPPVMVQTPKTARLAGDSMRLTSVFLLASACSVCYDVPSTSKIMYEIMMHAGITATYPVTSQVVLRYIETLNGCREGFGADGTGLTPRDLYVKLCTQAEFTRQSQQQHSSWPTQLYQSVAGDVLSRVLSETFTAARDMDNVIIELHGSQGGLWVAFLLIWMRPSEVSVFLDDQGTQLYPFTDTSSGPSVPRPTPRFVVYLRAGSPTLEIDPQWEVKTWQTANKATELIYAEADNMHESPSNLKLTFRNPWALARLQIAEDLGEGCDRELMAIGHVAAALIQYATEKCYVSLSRLLDICPQWYLNNYTTIMQYFGWDDIRPDLRQSLVTFLVEESPDPPGPDPSTRSIPAAADIIESLVVPCIERFGREIRDTDILQVDAVARHAIHLTSQALEMVVFRELPKARSYRCLDHTEYNKSCLMLVDIITPSSAQRCGLSLHDWRSKAIDAIIPSARGSMHPSDLAFAAEGYVIFKSVLAHDQEIKIGTNVDSPVHKKGAYVKLDDPRQVGTYDIFPGSLRCRDIPGHYKRLVEAEDGDLLFSYDSGRNPSTRSQHVSMFGGDGQFTGIPEADAHLDHEFDTTFFLRREDNEQAIYLETRFHPKISHPGQRNTRSALGSWCQSIDTTMYARHLRQMTSSHAQVEALARDVWKRDRLSISWNDSYIPGGRPAGERIITRTARDVLGRFFAAGYASNDGYTDVYIRHRGVTLTHCVKVAMESHNERWVIIA